MRYWRGFYTDGTVTKLAVDCTDSAGTVLVSVRHRLKCLELRPSQGVSVITFKSILQELGEDHAAAAQRIWESLLIAAVSRSGGEISSIQTTTEYRRADGGKDIVVGKPGQPDRPGLLRTGPTIYSVKSGKYATEPQTLAEELDESKHPQLVKATRSGQSFVYCVFADSSIDKQQALQKCATEIAGKLGVLEKAFANEINPYVCEWVRRRINFLRTETQHFAARRAELERG